MWLLLDDQNRITAWSDHGGFPEGSNLVKIDKDALPEGFAVDFWSGKWKMDNGGLTLSGESGPEEPEPEPDIISEILAATVDQEYRLTLIEMGVTL